MQPRWEHFEHEADVGVRGFGATPAEAFEQAAIALAAVVADPGAAAAIQAVEIHCEAADTEALLFEWLNALVFEMATRDLLFARFKVRLEGERLTATAWGEPVSPARHRPAVEVKGATYTGLSVCREPDGSWRAQCVVDV